MVTEYMKEHMLRNLELYHHWIFERMVSYEFYGCLGLTVTCNDGSSWLYDDLDQAIRRLPVDKNNLTEEECKLEFGMRLSRKMFHKRLTQADLSEMTGIPQSQISNYIRGKTSPSFYNVDKLARALECSVDDLRYI